MRKLEAIIRKSKFRHVKKSLNEQGITGFNYHLVRSSSKSEHRYYRGVEYDTQAEERIKLSLYVPDSKLDTAIQIIKSSGNTGNSTDSYLVVFQLDQVYKLQRDENENEDTLIELK